jgi:hypothetical protein
MRLSTIPLLALLVAGAGGCGYATRAQSRYPAPQGYANPGQWVPLVPPAQPRQFGQLGQPALPPDYFQLQPIFRPVNVQALSALQGRVPCSPKEVAPGAWATFDCAPFQAITQAVAYIPFVRFNLLPAGPLPAAVDHRAEGHEGPVKDQGAVGTCTAVSLSSAMDHAVRRLGRQDVISALHLWSRYGMGVTGQAGDSNVGKAVALEQTWPYDAVKACKLARSPMDTCGIAYGVSSGSEAFEPELKAEHANADANGRYRLGGIEQIHAKPADPAQMAALLAAGDDVWISFSVNDQAWLNRSLQDGVIPDYETVDDTGHAVVLAGYRTLSNRTKQFLVHNSWSARWGENGYGWISEAMVAKYTRAAYRVRITDAAGGGTMPNPSVPAPPLPSQHPKQTPASSDCPAGEVKEPVFGTCIPDGLPGLPGAPAPGRGPARSQPHNGCPQGQAPDMVTGQCTSTCIGGGPSIGGMCLPIPQP